MVDEYTHSINVFSSVHYENYVRIQRGCYRRSCDRELFAQRKSIRKKHIANPIVVIIVFLTTRYPLYYTACFDRHPNLYDFIHE